MSLPELAGEVLGPAERAAVLYSELRRRARAALADGYPTASGSGRSSGVALPTEAAALSNVAHRCHEAADQIVRALRDAAKLLAEAETSAARLGVVAYYHQGVAVLRATEAAPRPVGEVGCKSHARFKDSRGKAWSVPTGAGGRRGLCGFCEAFEREEEHPETVALKKVGGPWPPEELLRRHDVRGRVSSKDLAEVRLELIAAGRERRRKARR